MNTYVVACLISIVLNLLSIYLIKSIETREWELDLDDYFHFGKVERRKLPLLGYLLIIFTTFIPICNIFVATLIFLVVNIKNHLDMNHSLWELKSLCEGTIVKYSRSTLIYKLRSFLYRKY